MIIAGQKRFGPGDFSVGLVHEVVAILCKVGFSPDMAKRIADIKSGMAEKIVNLFTDMTIMKVSDHWEDFYREIFGLDLDFSKLRIPECPGPGWRLIVIARGITAEQAFQACKKLFRVHKYTSDSLDDVFINNQRDSKNGSYAVWVRRGQQAEKLYKDMPTTEIKRMGTLTETLTEHLVHELKFFSETKNHLDTGFNMSNATCCSGSCDRSGKVPVVSWGRVCGKLSLGWIFDIEMLGNGRMCHREVVS